MIAIRKTQCNSTILDNIGLIKLATKLVWSDKIKPLKLAEPGFVVPYYADAFIMTGWGVSTETNIDPNNLRKLRARFIHDNLCEASYNKLNFPAWTLRFGSQDQCYGPWYESGKGGMYITCYIDLCIELVA